MLSVCMSCLQRVIRKINGLMGKAFTFRDLSLHYIKYPMPLHEKDEQSKGLFSPRKQKGTIMILDIFSIISLEY